MVAIPGPRTRLRPLAVVARVFAGTCVLLAPAPARGEPPGVIDGSNAEDQEDDLLRDADIDEFDRDALRVAGHTGSAELHGESWVSLLGFGRELASGKTEVGAGVVLAFALDRIGQGPVHGMADVSRASSGAAAQAPRAGASSFARDCVLAAWRVAGMGVDDSAIDSLEARSRLSAALPETRLRAMRLFTDAQHSTLLAASDATNYYDAVGANLALEARLTWRLDRILYAGDEPTLERLRLERQEARARLGTRALEAFFAWQRAALEEADLDPASRERRDAALKTVQARATLDVLTGGWFSARLSSYDPS